MTLVMNQLLDSKLTEVDDEEEKSNKYTKKQEDDALVLWDCVSLFDTEDEGILKQEEISKTNVTNKSQYLLNKTIQYFQRLRNFKRR